MSDILTKKELKRIITLQLQGLQVALEIEDIAGMYRIFPGLLQRILNLQDKIIQENK